MQSAKSVTRWSLAAPQIRNETQSCAASLSLARAPPLFFWTSAVQTPTWDEEPDGEIREDLVLPEWRCEDGRGVEEVVRT